MGTSGGQVGNHAGHSNLSKNQDTQGHKATVARREAMKGDKLGRRQTRATQKENRKFGRQGGSGSQEPRT